MRNISDVWENFIAEHVSQEFFDKATEIIKPFMTSLDPNYLTNLGKELDKCSFSLAESGRGNNPKNKRSDIVISVAAGINTPCSKSSTIDLPHTDFPQKLFNSMLYMRKEDDDSVGGDLILYETTTPFIFGSKSELSYEVDKKYIKAVKTIKYSKNVLVLFPQKVNAVHGVSARGPTPHTRRYININMESYTLKQKVFFKSPRSSYAKCKFMLLNLIGLKHLKSFLRPAYYFFSKKIHAILNSFQ